MALLLRVALPVPLRRLFSYAPPAGWTGLLPPPGTRVLVPFSGRRLTGFVVEHTDHLEAGVEPQRVVAICDPEPLLDPAMLDLLRQAARHYLAPIGDALRAAAPPGGALREERLAIAMPIDDERSAELFPGERVDPSLGKVQRALLELLRARGEMSVGALARALGRGKIDSSLARLEERGLIRTRRRLRARAGARRLRVLALVDAAPEGGIGPKGVELVELLRTHGGSLPTGELARRHGFSQATFRSLVRRGIARFEERVVTRKRGMPTLPRRAREIVPSAAQTHAIAVICDSVRARDGRAFLLHGVTGSGKTHVYLEAAAATLEQGRGVLVLVPEIALTPQLFSLFEERFPGRVAVLHSALSAGERRDAWFAIRAGSCPITIGARSAVFAPLPDLGLLVVDEEHESAYKDSGAFPYHAREVARLRAERSAATLVLGSATPSLESYSEAAQGDSTELLRLPERVDSRSLPLVHVVDMVLELRRGNREAFSVVLRDALRERLEAGQQTILLLNRRGYSPAIQCVECGLIPECDECAVRLVYHRHDERLRCHYCAAERALPSCCSGCGAERRHLRGWGTQRVEEELERRFPQARVLRMDQDATRRKDAHFEILASFARREADILLGTQMVAKGLDLPDVTLVGVINADIGLSIADFRAGERTFQLLTQVSGRAGRGALAGEVIVQTHAAANYAIKRAQTHDFESFYEQEIGHRRELRYPPFSRLIVVLVRGRELRAVAVHADALATALRRGAGRALAVLGPADAPVARIQGEHRQQILIKSGDLDEGRRCLLAVLRRLSQPRAVTVSVDVDPERMG